MIEFVKTEPFKDSYFQLDEKLTFSLELVQDLMAIQGLDTIQELRNFITAEQKALNLEPHTDEEWEKTKKYILKTMWKSDGI